MGRLIYGGGGGGQGARCNEHINLSLAKSHKEYNSGDYPLQMYGERDTCGGMPSHAGLAWFLSYISDKPDSADTFLFSSGRGKIPAQVYNEIIQRLGRGA